ncbi:DUF4145 domain-containing protein (plasmid) [Vibrio tubiashii]|uniref:DUF4145 domain-containing protein n=1 Tax=Vibrio tubiashii TaxID=29498 RepID=UPI003CE4934C
MEYCPYCSSDKGLEFKYLSRYSEDSYSIDKSNPYTYEHSGHMFVRECLSCHRLILSDDYGGELPSSLCDKSEVIYPSLLENSHIPLEVRLTFQQAKRIQNLNFDAFCLSIRKCIEIICKLNGIEKGNLHSKLKKLCAKNSLPPLIMEAANCIRELGNQAAHDIEDIHPINANQIEEFFLILIEYLYILPARLEWFKSFQSGEFENHQGLITKDRRWVMQKGKYPGFKP